MKEYWSRTEDRFMPCPEGSFTFGAYDGSCTRCSDLGRKFPNDELASYVQQNCKKFDVYESSLMNYKIQPVAYDEPSK